jgi:hypothetical protein
MPTSCDYAANEIVFLEPVIPPFIGGLHCGYWEPKKADSAGRVPLLIASGLHCAAFSS